MPATSRSLNDESPKGEPEPGPSTSEAPPVERALLRTVPALVGALLISAALLLFEAGQDPIVAFLLQLSALVAYSLLLVELVVDLGTHHWFVWMGWSIHWRLISSGIGLVVLVTGTTGLVAVASSAALRYDPSTQFLQLLSALDIAWVVAAVVIGAYRVWGRLRSVAIGAAIGVICVWSIWRYLNHVGFGPNGEWIVSGTDLLRFVLPFDMMAALVAVVAFLYGTRRAAQAIEQPRPQS